VEKVYGIGLRIRKTPDQLRIPGVHHRYTVIIHGLSERDRWCYAAGIQLHPCTLRRLNSIQAGVRSQLPFIGVISKDSSAGLPS